MTRGTRDFRGPSTSKIRTFFENGSTYYESTLGMNTNKGWYQMIDPMKTPGTKFVPGRFAVNPVTITKYSSSSTPGTLLIPYSRGWGLGYEWTGDLIASVTTSSCDTSPGWSDPTAAERCKIKAYAKMNSPSSDLGLLLAEAKETLGMMINPLNGARSLIMQMVKGGSRRWKNPVKYMADQWLEYRYGILPAVSDFNMLRERFRSKTQFDISKLFRESSRFTQNPAVTAVPSGAVVAQYIQVMKEVETSYKRFTVATVYYSRTTPPSADTGAGLHDLPSLIWELVPFSFVVDWAFNTGDFLRAKVQNPSCAPLGMSISHVEERRVTTRCQYATHPSHSGKFFGTDSQYSEEQKTLKRVFSTGLPALPSVNPTIMNLNRGLDSLSLAWAPATQALQKFRR
jgi:hypothetical protein